jgi:hypothetical protein
LFYIVATDEKLLCHPLFSTISDNFFRLGLAVVCFWALYYSGWIAEADDFTEETSNTRCCGLQQ